MIDPDIFTSADVLNYCTKIKYRARLLDMDFREEDYIWVFGTAVADKLLSYSELKLHDTLLRSLMLYGIPVEVSYHDDNHKIALYKEVNHENNI